MKLTKYQITLLMRMAFLLLGAVILARWIAWAVFAYINGVLSVGGTPILAVTVLAVPLVALMFEFFILVEDYLE